MEAQTITQLSAIIGGILGILSFIITTYRQYREMMPKPKMEIGNTIIGDHEHRLMMTTFSIENLGKDPLKITRMLFTIEHFKEDQDLFSFHADSHILLKMIDPDIDQLELEGNISHPETDLDDDDIQWLSDINFIRIKNLKGFLTPNRKIEPGENPIEQIFVTIRKPGFYRTTVVVKTTDHPQIFYQSHVIYIPEEKQV